jgi:hypothetical protein
MCSSDTVISVVATDRTTVATTIVMTAHSGKCAAAVVGGGGEVGVVMAGRRVAPVAPGLPTRREQGRSPRS